MTTAVPTMQQKSLNSPDEVAHYGRITKEFVTLQGLEAHRVTFGPGARWSTDLKPVAGSASCELPHVAYMLAGRLHVAMDDGAEEEFGAGDVMLLPPGHDAQTVGEDAYLFVELTAGTDYYSR